VNPRSVRSPLTLLAAAAMAAGLGVVHAEVRLPPFADRSVHDLAGVISPGHVRTMERLHRELFEKTGVAIVVVTVPSLDGEPIDAFAVRVGAEWGAGRKGEDRGIVVALSVSDRRVFIATGYGVEGFLPDGRVGGILDRYAIPSLREDDFSTGILRTSSALVAAAAEEHGVSIEGAADAVPRGGGRTDRPGPLAKLLGLLMAGVMVYLFIRHPSLFLLLLMSGGRRGGRGGFGGGGFGGGRGFGGFGGGGFGGGGAGRGF